MEFFFKVFMLTHIPISLLIDGQAIAPATWHPAWARNVVDLYVQEFQDPYLRNPPVWFKSFVWCELTVQLLLLIPGVIGLIKRKNWARDICIIYGAHVATTVVPIIAEVAMLETISSRNKMFL
eukprot:Ihof_evm29s10 gene=Ihof_evmTU29s10